MKKSDQDDLSVSRVCCCMMPDCSDNIWFNIMMFTQSFQDRYFHKTS